MPRLDGANPSLPHGFESVKVGLADLEMDNIAPHRFQALGACQYVISAFWFQASCALCVGQVKYLLAAAVVAEIVGLKATGNKLMVVLSITKDHSVFKV